MLQRFMVRSTMRQVFLWGDRRSYQMDIHNRKEALKEIDSDGWQRVNGIVMVKPALSYLDIIFRHPSAPIFRLPLTVSAGVSR